MFLSMWCFCPTKLVVCCGGRIFMSCWVQVVFEVECQRKNVNLNIISKK